MPACNIKSEIVGKPSFPAYAIASVSERHVVVGGGGGAARTGIKNKFDVYELYHDGTQTKAERVVSHDVGDSCISNLAGWSDPVGVDQKNTFPTINLALGQDEKCCLLKLHPKMDSPLPYDIPLEDTVIEEDNITPIESVRNRCPDNTVSRDKLKEEIARRRKQERIRRESINSTLRGDHYFTFNIEDLVVKDSVFGDSSDPYCDIYQKVVRVSPDGTLLCTGGTDGRLRLWVVSDLTVKLTIDAHQKEVDDLDFSPDGKQVVSVCKPTKESCIWSLKDGEKVINLVYKSDAVKYKFYRARYGTVERSKKDTRLFTISNPVTGTKHPGVVVKWSTKDYSAEKREFLKGTLSSLAVSDNGRYVATGTMDGSVYLLIAFSLQLMQRVEAAHSMFVTGLEWMPTASATTDMVCGFSDASVCSISCDNVLKIHHIPRQGMIPIWLVTLITFVVLTSAFIVASFLGL